MIEGTGKKTFPPIAQVDLNEIISDEGISSKNPVKSAKAKNQWLKLNLETHLKNQESSN